MPKLVDPNNPAHKYEPPICRYVSMLPLEEDAMRKRGLPVFPAYKMRSEPAYSCPGLSRKKEVALFSAKINEYEGRDAKGNKYLGNRLELASDNGANLSIEQTEFAVRVMWADEKGVAELLPGRDLLIRVSRREAARILKRNLRDGSCLYILGEAPCFHPIRPAIPRDTEKWAQPDSAIFMIGPVDVYPKGRISWVTVDGQEIEEYRRRRSSV